MNVQVPIDILEGFNAIVKNSDDFEFFLVGFEEMEDSKLFSFQCNFSKGNSKTISFREIIFDDKTRIMEVLDGKSSVIVELPNSNPGFTSMPILEKVSANLNNIKDIATFANLMNHLMKDLTVKEKFAIGSLEEHKPPEDSKPLTTVEKIFRWFLRFLT